MLFLILKSHRGGVFLLPVKSLLIPNVAFSLLNRGVLFPVVPLHAPKCFKQPFSHNMDLLCEYICKRLGESGALDSYHFGFKRRIQSTVTKSGRIDNSCEGPFERIHLLPTLARLFTRSHATSSLVNW